MARKADPGSAAFLKRQVIELVAVNEALAEKLAAFVADHEATVETLTDKANDAQGDAAYTRTLWEGARASTRELTEQRDALKKEVQQLKEQVLPAQLALRGMEVDRDRARAAAESMRQIAYPAAPEFPWEKPLKPVGPYDPMTGIWKGN